jgi:hypothetical protein
MSLELSKEMISVQGYLRDAKLLMSQQLGNAPPDSYHRVVIEIARMLQQERHHQRKKLVSDKAGSAPLTHSRSAQAVLDARKNPQTPPVVSFDDDEEEEPTPKPRRKKIESKRKIEPKKKAEPKKRVAKPRRR